MGKLEAVPWVVDSLKVPHDTKQPLVNFGVDNSDSEAWEVLEGKGAVLLLYS